MLTKKVVDELLGFLEHHETRLLSWGFYDFVHTTSSVRELLQNNGAPASLTSALSQIEMQGVSLANILEELAFVGLLHRARPNMPEFRTRYAESVRLIARLRQVFRSSDWDTGRPLVADIKLDLRHRTFPDRLHSVEQCWSTLEPYCTRPGLQRAVFDALSTTQTKESIKFARFQRTSFERILQEYNSQGVSGTVVTAGTGSGKTKAFYIPAFLGMAAELSSEEFVKVIAVYPRNVLLADQLREAISEALKAESVLREASGRGFTFGALTGQTRFAQEFNSGKDVWEWKRLRTGYRVPFLLSPYNGNSLVWRDSDRLAGRNCLYDEQGGNEPVIPDGLLALTRDEIRSHPPDVLFVSAEMLNRLMGDRTWDKALGIGRGHKSPRLFLLDEVHSHEGIKGAQIGWVLRRWRFWSQASTVHFVGLSATLRQADEHLSKLAGIARSKVAVCAPTPVEMKPLGREYNLAVKGDPVSGASLLATSIQCGMLLPRLLTPRATACSSNLGARDFYASKVFGFTDNLDSVNRWFSDIRNAETDKRLARFRLEPTERLPPEPEVPKRTLDQMRLDGQLWELPKSLGHNLNLPLNVTRCSSQDTGADPGSDLIVATSALEVGYDDPEVGGVLHHKHPKTISSFIQRKGRSGRRVGTRPWTVTVLSDFGADRWYFNNAERLFDPEIDTISLPLLNPFVLRSQTTYFLIEWIGRELNSGEPFQYLAPRRNQEYKWNAAEGLLRKLLSQGKEWGAFRRDLLRAFTYNYGRKDLQLSQDLAEGLMWEQPRPLVLEVIPTLLRKIEGRWRFANPTLKDEIEDATARVPLPEFLPYATFGEVGISSVAIDLPGHDQDTVTNNSIPATSLYEVCPGRVSKRFVTEVGKPGVWLRGSETLARNPDTSIAIDAVFPGSISLGKVGECTVFQPTRAKLIERPKTILDSSDGAWLWQTDLRMEGSGVTLGIFEGSIFSKCFESATAYLHRERSFVQITRFAESFIFDTKSARGTSTRGVRNLGCTVDNEWQRQAVGFRQYLDGLVFNVPREHLATLPTLDQDTISRFRPDYYLYRLRNSDVLRSKASSFAVERLWLTSVSMIVSTALAKRCSLNDALGFLMNRGAAAKKVLSQITRNSGDEDPRAAEAIEQLWNDSEVRKEVENLEQLLWQELPPEFEDWVRERYVSTLAEAFRATAVDLVPELSEENIQVDVVSRANKGVAIAITELTSGGVGYIENIIREFRRRPSAVHSSLRNHLQYCPRDQFSEDILYALETSLSASGSTLSDVFEDARSVNGFRETLRVREQLELALESVGLCPSRGLVVGLLAKVLKPGSNRETDVIMYMLNKARRRHNKSLGVQIDARVFGYAALSRKPVRDRLQQRWSAIGRQTLEDYQLFNAVDQTLLTECKDSCNECLGGTQPFSARALPSRQLATKWLELIDNVVPVASDWDSTVKNLLSTVGRATVVAEVSQMRDVVRALHSMLAEEIERDYLLLPIVIESVVRRGSEWRITVILSEVPNA